MKKSILLAVLLTLFSCENDDDFNNNPFLVDISFQVILNTNLPQYADLDFPGNSVVIPNQGLRGVVVYYIGNNDYRAFELSDPNHSPNSCSTMRVNGIEATCPCPDDNFKYNIITGEPMNGGEFPMKPYRATRQGDDIIVSN
ncbi:Rieske (2Fe-2S) protein [Nonlabens ponticola]|nr:hypothetical protein [Nonlabens ponticola]